MHQELFGGIEAGGTKFICAIGQSPDTIVEYVRIPTTSPDETLRQIVAFFTKRPVERLGIGSFGPLQLNKDLPDYGFITSTPKQGWANTDLVGMLQRMLQVPITLETDVNCAVLGEQLYGAGKGLSALAYMTVGTGIGVGCISNSRIISGINHTEMGHMLIPRSKSEQEFSGSCTYHGDCLEGLASGRAIRHRWGTSASELPTNHPGWELEAEYLACAIVNTILSFMPERIIVGGGVMNHAGLLDNIRSQIVRRLRGYIEHPRLNDIESYITSPALEEMSGVMGALALTNPNYFQDHSYPNTL
jgi:fructokinase